MTVAQTLSSAHIRATGITGLPTCTILAKMLRFSNLGKRHVLPISSSTANASGSSEGVYVAVAGCKAKHLDKQPQPEKQQGSCCRV